MTNRELAARLLASFLDELDEQIRTLNAEVLALERTEVTGEGVRALFRVAHTLKGAARAANVPSVEQVCHELETLLADARSGATTLGAGEFALLFEAADALEDAGRRLREGGSLAVSPIAALATRLASARGRSHVPGGRVAGEDSGPAPQLAQPARTAPGSASRKPPVVTHAPAAAPTPGAAGNDATLRVSAEKLDALMASVSALAHSRGQAAAQSTEAATLERELEALLARWRRHAAPLRRRAGEPGGDHPATFLADTEQTLERLARRAAHLDGIARRHERALAQVEETIAARARVLRMRPFSDLAEALPRVARDVAASLGKEVQLELRGTGVEADRAVLDGLREPLVHLLRNAIDHGIEPAAVRRQRGKSDRGLVVIAAALRGDRLVISVSDDGGGIDAGAVRAALGRRGSAAPVDDRALAGHLLDGGLTTRAEASAISGRGVGLDVVRSAVERLGGTVGLDWRAGVGTTFTLDCPVLMAQMRAVLVGAGAQAFALPAAHVERLRRVPRAEVRRTGNREVLPMRMHADAEGPPEAGDAAPVPIVSLARLLGPPLVARPAADPLSVVIVNGTGVRLALAVDELLGEEELIVRPLPRGYGLPPALAGAALRSDGGLALALNVTALAAAAAPHADLGPGADTASTPARRHRILVADDSITTRTLELSVLEAAGYDVVAAVDGVDAWRQLEDGEFDLVVSDVEMPRMDGFALCEAIRASAQLSRLPVVLVTAKEAPADRARGLEVGADAYLGKSGFDQHDLLRVVRELLD